MVLFIEHGADGVAPAGSRCREAGGVDAGDGEVSLHGIAPIGLGADPIRRSPNPVAFGATGMTLDLSNQGGQGEGFRELRRNCETSMWKRTDELRFCRNSRITPVSADLVVRLGPFFSGVTFFSLCADREG